MSNDVEIGVSSKLKSKKGFDDAEREGKKLEKSLDGMGSRAGQGLGKVGGKLSEGLAGAFKAGPLAAVAAGGLIGTALIGTMNSALEQGDIKATLAAQLGLAGADAEKYGTAAADLWKNGYGASIQETADITKAAFESGLVSAKSSKQAISEVGQQVAVYNKLSGEDAVAATRAVAQMIKTGLAKNATEAFDILTKGQQLGINKSQDLLDTFNEYGTQFRKLGLSASDSLGLMNQLIQGGARDSDTAADAIKEFSIRAVDGSKTTAAGFKALGLNAAQMSAEIGKGGPTARAAFGEILTGLNKITDPVKREQAGVALFGTKWEDLGAAMRKADLKTAAGSLGQVAGATENVNAALGATPSAKIEVMRRKLQQTFVDLFAKHALPTVTKFVDWLSGPGVYKISEAFVTIGLSLTTMVKLFGPAMKLMTDMFLNWTQSMIDGAVAAFGWLPGVGPKLKKAQSDFSTFRTGTSSAFDAVIRKANDWDGTLRKTKTELKLKADKADLDQKLAAAKAQLRDPALTATKRAKLQATIDQLQRQVNAAQAKIDSLHGKTVAVTVNTYKNMIETTIPGGSLIRTRATGGAVSGYASGGSPMGKFLVGEDGPELMSMSGGVGRVTPASNTGQQMRGMGGVAKVVLEFAGGRSSFEDLLLAFLKEHVRVRGGGNVQLAFGRGA
jgi:phage-related minor tail protein